jgi:hypothetical protein
VYLLFLLLFTTYVLHLAPADMAVWEYKENNSMWTTYPPEINEHIEKAYQKKPKGKTIIKIKQKS